MHTDSLNTRLALASSTCLNHTYIVEGILGEGGFAITYYGTNKTTGIRFAIKEYFPADLAVRTEQENTFLLRPISTKKEELFLHGRQRFLNEARILKEFRHLESIVSVYDVFEENNTAYIVMEYIEGLTLKQYVEENGCLCFTELFPLITPIIRSLSVIHKKKLIHRDISPDNLILGTDNRLHLIDFGASSSENTSDRQHTIILKSGYAPPEQYLSNSKTGAWTDVYALCATMYFAFTGNPPSDAIQRLEEDSLDFSDAAAQLLPWQTDVLKKGLHIHISRRFRDMDELYEAFTTPPETETLATMTGITLTKKERQKIRHIRRRLKIPLLFSLFLFLLSSVALIISVGKSTQTTLKSPSSQSAPRQPDKTAAANPSSKTSHPDAPLSMPKLSGLSLNQAKKVLKNLDETIQVKTTKIYHSKADKGQVIYQSVEEETLFSKGHLPAILLTISRGKKQTPPRKNNQKPSKATPQTSPTTNTIITKAPKTAKKHKISPKPQKSQKKSSDNYHLTPEDNDFITIPFD